MAKSAQQLTSKKSGAVMPRFTRIAARPASTTQQQPLHQNIQPRPNIATEMDSTTIAGAGVGMEQTAIGSELASFDADDTLIQELLAGIPSTAWLPTDPLTSEDWFPDPSSSVITQDYPLQTVSQPASEAAFQHSGAETPVGNTAAAAETFAKTPIIGSSQAPTVGCGNKDLPIGLGARQTGNARAKQSTPGSSRRSSSNAQQRTNPLSGFAKKHGIGYAVGNQMAILSPELLSSSPPKRKQLMQNPYKYYSPPKPLLPRPSSQTKGRNLGLGTRASRPSQPTLAAAAQAAQRQRTGERSGVAKWAITQDKLLLRGVRLQRWRHGTARDPSRFAGSEWEQISQEVTRGGVARSARQCRRRWAVMYQHLGNAIMDFVDSTPTPQSSTQSTPALPAGINSGTADSGAQGGPRYARNLQLSNLPQSSPPLVTGGREGMPAELAPLDLQSLNIDDRWSTPAYCQLLADVVQALTNPQSKAADVVRRHVSQTDTHNNNPSELTQGSSSKQADAMASRLVGESVVPSIINGGSLLPPRTSGNAPSGQLCTNLQNNPSTVASSSLTMPSKPKAALVRPGVRIQSSEPLRSTSFDTHVAASGGMDIQTPLITAESTLASAGATSGVTSQPVVSGEGMGLATGSLDMGVGDQDLSVYLEFIQSLTSDQIDLNSAWTSLLDDSTGNNVASLVSGATTSVSAAPSKLSLTPSPAARQTQENRINVDDDDASDGDFVLNDSEDGDDDDDDYEEDTENEPYSSHVRFQTGALGNVSQVDNTAPSQLPTYSGGTGENSWERALHQLGLATSTADTSFTSTLANPNISGTGGDLVPDALIQQLMQGVTDTSSVEAQGTGAANTSQTAWLPSIAADFNIFSQLDFGDASGAGSSGCAPTATDLVLVGAQAEEQGQAAGDARPTAAPDGAPGTVPRRNNRVGAKDTSALDGRGVHRSHSHQSQLQRQTSETTPSKRGVFRAARKLAKKPASTSLVKALMMDGLGGNDIDTEMDGLFQDALQEGEDLDVQEESLSMDHGALLFTADQLALLREQQMQNFQFVSQAFLISCAETSPHAERSRHWKRQLDQLALWHSLGTRESPSDLMSPGGLRAFGELIESAEQQQGQSGAVGITASGRFAPNPASFFAIPGITAVVPDIYEAVDEIHRATQLSGDIEKPEGERIARVRRPAPGAQPVVRSYDSNVNFTAQCRCTPIAALQFKSALVLECVFPRMHLELRNGKRKAADADSPDNSKQQALLPRSDGGERELTTLPGMKPLAPLVKPMPRNLSVGPGAGDVGVRRASRDGSGLALIMPAATSEGAAPAYTQADMRVLVEEMKSQMRTFRREIHRVPRSRRRIFVQGDDGVPRLDWMKMKIDPLMLPPAMHYLLQPLLTYSGFRDTLLPRIVAVRKPKNRIHFLESEDTLLFRGLRLFGLEDVASMRVHMMPCKTASQLRNRINNLRARRAPQNPVKEYCLRTITPITLEEEEILRVGTEAFGEEFRQMNQNFLVNRPLLALTHWSPRPQNA
ncbi:hypothetical protein H4R24_004976 [Coemansia sp. RSA 988]|nr:hypothetical protein H4R24_004976 [Coemansia sp. RSA 988]